MARLVDRIEDAGRHTVAWDGLDEMGAILPSGMYFARLRAGSEVKAGKLILVGGVLR